MVCRDIQNQVKSLTGQVFWIWGKPMMTQTEIARLAALGNCLRPDWPNSSLFTFITKSLAGRPYRDVAVALTWVACDPNTLTPKRLLEAGPWWKAVADPATVVTNRPPRKVEECAHHPGEWAGACRGCAADQLTGDITQPAELRRPDRAVQVARVRAELANTQAKENA